MQLDEVKTGWRHSTDVASCVSSLLHYATARSTFLGYDLAALMSYRAH